MGLFVLVITPSGLSLSYLFDECVPMPSWVCQWKPFWIPVGDSFKKAFVEEWFFVSGESSDGQNVMDFPVLHSTDYSDCIPETPRISKQFASLPWEPTRPQDTIFAKMITDLTRCSLIVFELT